MKRFFVFALLVCAGACGVLAQTVDTTVCAIVKNPKSFDGKIVRVKGMVVAGLDEFIVKDSSPCGYPVDGIWISYPQGTKGKAGAAMMVQVQPAHNFMGSYAAPTRTPVTLEKNKEFKDFDNMLSQPHAKGLDMCLGCVKYMVNATLVGRLDGVESASLKRDKDGKIIEFGGFGNMNAYPARLVLQSVSEVTGKEEDYSKVDALQKDPNAAIPNPPGGFDPVDAAQKSTERLAGSPAGTQVAKDVAVFAKSNEHNGVSIIYAATNEAAPKDEEHGAKDSPDGVLFNCIVNQNRLQGFPLVRAIIHLGQHVVDLRTPVAGNEDAPLYIQEYNAWSMTVAVAAFSGQKFLTMPGGYSLWNYQWPAGDRNATMDQAMKDFLANEAALSR